MNFRGGSSADTQTFCCDAGVEHVAWNITVFKWKTSNVEPKVIPLIKELTSNEKDGFPIHQISRHVTKL